MSSKKVLFIVVLYGFLVFKIMFDILPNSVIILSCVLLVCIIGIEISNYKANKKRRIQAHRAIENKIKAIEKYKEKFKYDLIGYWISCEGTFSSIRNERWIFYSNGRGITIYNSLMTDEDKQEFMWRKKGLYCIEIAYLEEGEVNNWREVFYDFCIISTDYGDFIALVELDSEGKSKNGFGPMNIPLVYESAAE